MKKRIDPADIRREVRKGQLEFYIENCNICCRELPVNGEVFYIGKVNLKEFPFMKIEDKSHELIINDGMDD